MTAQHPLPLPSPAEAAAWRAAAEMARRQFPDDHKRHAYYDEQARLREAKR